MLKGIAILISLILFACTNTDTSDKSSKATDEADIQNALIALYGKKVEPDMTEVEKHPLGSAKNPVRAAGPAGQRQYLSRLICEDGEPMSVFSRVGSSGIGPYGSIMDIYNVICDTENGVVEHRVYMDMYHSDYVETRPAAGFRAVK